MTINVWRPERPVKKECPGRGESVSTADEGSMMVLRTA